MTNTLPPALARWFEKRKWSLFPHQLAMLEAAKTGEDILLLAPTGSGKTLAGFLPSLVDLITPSPLRGRDEAGRGADNAPRGEERVAFENASGEENTNLSELPRPPVTAMPLLPSPGNGGGVGRGWKGARGNKRKEKFSSLHTLYISPLKALANDVHRNLIRPIEEAMLEIRIETRTGDTAQKDKVRQRKHPPHILLTTPESLALLLTHADAAELFAGLHTIILDEIHTLVSSKRGDQTALLLARLARIAPRARRIGLSATVAEPDKVAAWLGRPLSLRGVKRRSNPEKENRIAASPPAPRNDGDKNSISVQPARILRAEDKGPPEIGILYPEAPLPLAGHYGTIAMKDIYRAICGAQASIVFVNTRAQAELTFQTLWQLNEKNLAIGLHHGSLTREQRQKVEAAMAEGKVRAVVATSSLDLGIDWGNVDLVLQLGAPKGLSRLRQRIGRSNHRFDATSRALLVPANRFEALECEAAKDALARGQLDDLPPHERGGLDVLAQHVFSCACAGGFAPEELLAEIRAAYPYRYVTRAQFDEVVEYVRDGGYVLKRYDRFVRLKEDEDGRLGPATPLAARRHRMNIGTIVESEMLNVVRVAGKAGGKRRRFGVKMGKVEERLVTGMRPGDTFLFAGQVWAFQGVRDMDVEVVPATGQDPKIPAYNGGKMPLSTHLAAEVRHLLRDHERHKSMPVYIQEWLAAQEKRSVLPPEDGLLVEAFPHGKAHYVVAYPYEGRAVHQSLGFLVTRRMEEAKLGPLGFTVSDYGLCIWSVREPKRDWLETLFEPGLAHAPMEEWLTQSAMLRRVFRTNAVIAGLIERKMPGRQHTGRQVTFSTDLIYDVLHRYEPDHLLLRTTRFDTERDMADLPRLVAFLHRVEGKIELRMLEQVTPFAIPVMLEITSEGVGGTSAEAAMAERTREEHADALWKEIAGGDS